jgi:hypothetical protein
MSKDRTTIGHKSLTTADYAVLTFIMMQLLFVGFYLPKMLEDVQMGVISLISASAFVIATLLLLAAALLMFFKSRFSVYVFAVSILFGLFAAINFHPRYVMNSIIVASAAIVVCLGQRKSKSGI